MSNLESGPDLGAEAAKFNAKKEETKPAEATIEDGPQPEDVEAPVNESEIAAEAGAQEGEVPDQIESTDENASEKQETPETEAESQEKSDKVKEITELSEKIEAIDAEMSNLRGSLEETKQQLNEVRKSLGIEDQGGPTETADDEKVKQLLEIRRQLVESSITWTEQNGRDALPEGLVREIDDENLESKGASFDRDYERKFPDFKEALENLVREIKKAYIAEFKKETVETFEKALRGNFRLGTAKNIDQVVSLMKIRVPNAIDKKSESFVNGDTLEPPFSAVWIKCKSSSIFEILAGKPNFIKKLDITFDDEVVNLGDDEALGANIEQPEVTAEEDDKNPETGQGEASPNASSEDEETTTE